MLANRFGVQAQAFAGHSYGEFVALHAAGAIGFGADTPGLSDIGVVDDLLVDRAFVPDRQESAQELLDGLGFGDELKN